MKRESNHSFPSIHVSVRCLPFEPAVSFHLVGRAMGANISQSHFNSYDFFIYKSRAELKYFILGSRLPHNITVSELRQNEDGSIITMKNKTNRIMLYLKEVTFVFKANKLFLQQEKSLALLSQAND